VGTWDMQLEHKLVFASIERFDWKQSRSRKYR